MVLDEPFLFSVSIRDNIAYGRPDASFDEVRRGGASPPAPTSSSAPCPRATTPWSASAASPSRVASASASSIARTLLVNPPILVLDDATSAIDVQIEQQIHEALRELMADRTTLIIAHRLSTISLADRVAVVEGGRVIAEGTHAELLATEPRYAEILAQADPDADLELDDGDADADLDAVAADDVDTVARARRRPRRDAGRRLMAAGGGGGTMTAAAAPMGGAVGGSPGNPGNGLPFAGIPWEMRQGVEKLLADEPDLTGDPRWQASDSTFTHRMKETGVSLRRMLRPHRRMMIALGGSSSSSRRSAVQAGPFLSQIGIDDGITPHDWTALAIIGDPRHRRGRACPRWRAVRASPPPAASRRAVMFELRVRTFAHLQRLSLDYYTDEKAGVIMTRMTSDIESLQQLLQDGLPQFALQGLTMVIVTVVLFFYNVELALITLLLIVPVLTGLSLWFRSASDKGYNRVRDGIAGVLSDLSESLSGVRVVTGFNRGPPQRAAPPQRHRRLPRRQRPHRAASRRRTARAPSSSGCSARRRCSSSAATWCATARSPSASSPRSSSTSTRSSGPIQSLVQQYNLYQQGQAAITKLDELLETHPTVEEAEDAEPLPPIEGAVTLEARVVRATTRPSRCSTTSTSTSRRGRRSRWSGPTGAGQVDHRQARHPLLRPDRGRGRDRRPRPARRHHRLAAPPARRGAAGAVPVRRHHARQHRLRPTRRDRRRGDRGGRPGRASRELIDRLPEGSTPRSTSGACRCRRASASSSRWPAPSSPSPRVLVLDEATSNLDLKSETQVEAGLDAVLEGRTAIIVAHRLSTAMRADRIAVVDDGRIIELGSHEELVAAPGAATRRCSRPGSRTSRPIPTGTTAPTTLTWTPGGGRHRDRTG